MTRPQQQPAEEERRQPTALLYARLASNRPADHDRLTAQLISCRLMAERLGATVLGEHTDTGIAGDDLDRPGLQQLIWQATSQLVDYVICTDQRRLSTDQDQVIDLLIRFAGYGTKVALARTDEVIDVPAAASDDTYTDEEMADAS